MPNAILDPTGYVSQSSQLALAPRPAQLRGATVGLVVTTKQNADVFCEELGRLLQATEGAAGLVLRRKTSVALPASDEIVEEIVRECDVMVTGVGDCGSCSASAVADGVIFEKHGMPSAVVCTDAFVATSDEMAHLHGAPGYRYVTTPHPVAVLGPDEVRERAERALPDILSLLVAGEARGAA